MTQFRQHMNDLRRAYRSAHYPGELAADVLGPTSWRQRLLRRFTPQWGWGAMSGAAAAAAIVAGVLLYRPAAQGGAALRDSLDSIRIAVQQTGLWGSPAQPDAPQPTMSFVPAPQPLDAPVPPLVVDPGWPGVEPRADLQEPA